MAGCHLAFWRIDAETIGRGGVHPIAYVGLRLFAKALELCIRLPTNRANVLASLRRSEGRCVELGLDVRQAALLLRRRIGANYFLRSSELQLALL